MDSPELPERLGGYQMPDGDAQVLHLETLPIDGPIFRLAGKRTRDLATDAAASGRADVERAPEVVGTGGSLERLRRELANRGRPSSFVKALRCGVGHALIWLVRTDRGLAPVASGIGRHDFTLRSIDGELMTLDQWPAGEHLPPASCACHDEVVISLYEAKRWVGAPQDKFVYSP